MGVIIQPNDISQTDFTHKTMVYPTETVYGIGCSIFDEHSTNLIYTIKGRTVGKPFIILTDTLNRVENLIKCISPTEHALLTSGLPITVLLKPSNTCPSYLLGESGFISIRISTHAICLELIKTISSPITSTSANISGYEAARSFNEISPELINRCDIIINGGVLPLSKPSTVVQIVDDMLIILREGCVAKEVLEKVSKTFK